MLPIVRYSLNYSNQSLKRKCPPRVNGAILIKIFVQVQRQMMVWKKSEVGKEPFYGFDVVTHESQILLRMFL